MDAVDAVLAEAAGGTFRVVGARRVQMPAPLAARLRRLADPGAHGAHGSDLVDELGDLDQLVGELFAGSVIGLLTALGVDPAEVRAIGSHGQTVRHRPRARRRFTLQIGDPNTIAARTGILVIADFRRRDMALGGQGAPLVPAFHAAMFADAAEPRAVLNLGGIANLTLLAPGAPVTGFDTGPGNTLMDGWTRRTLREPFDRDGHWAASGRVDANLLEALLAHPFLALAPPKSTGPEEFSMAWLDKLLERSAPCPAADVQATLAEFTAASVARALEGRPPHRLLVCGGGAHNRHLLRRLAMRLPGVQVESVAALGIDPDQVEAAAFAWLAARHLAGLPGNLPTVTGAARAAVLGAAWPA